MQFIFFYLLFMIRVLDLHFFSVLPEDDWFAEVAQISIKMLTGQANFGNVDQDIPSPTASVSAKSISSAISHGSN